MYTIDLHNHTCFSYDGSNTPEEIIENAIANNVDVIGISDHQFSIGDKLLSYCEYINNCKIKYADKIRVLCGLEIGTCPPPQKKLSASGEKFDYVLFESLDKDGAMDFFEFLKWQNQFKCKTGLAHTDIFKLSEQYGTDILKIMRDNNIFWELNTSGNYSYYYDFLTNERKRQLVRESGIAVSVGSDTHYIPEYRKTQIKRANELIQKMKLPMP